MVKRLFILNPHAGKGLWVGDLERFFKERAGSFEYRVCRSGEEAQWITVEALRSGVEQVIAVGGDGTVHAVVNGFMEAGAGTRCTLAISKTGTGSDYFRTVSAGDPLSDWRELVLENRSMPVDVGFFKSGETERFFANAASFGMSAEIVRLKEGLPRYFPKRLSYAAPTLLKVFRHESYPSEVWIDGQRLEVELLAAFMAKGAFVGNGMRIGGEPRLDDGKLGVTLILKMPLTRMIGRLGQLFKSGIEADERVLRFSAASVRIRSSKPLPAECDGELIDASDVEISVRRRALNLCVAPELRTAAEYSDETCYP